MLAGFLSTGEFLGDDGIRTDDRFLPDDWFLAAGRPTAHLAWVGIERAGQDHPADYSGEGDRPSERLEINVALHGFPLIPLSASCFRQVPTTLRSRQGPPLGGCSYKHPLLRYRWLVFGIGGAFVRSLSRR